MHQEFMKTNLQEKGGNSLHHNKLEHKFIPVPQTMSTPETETAVDKECRKLEKIRRGIWRKSETKSEVNKI